jgi:hypothetical protein
MTALANFRHQARGGQPQREEQVVPDGSQPGVSVSARFPFQSYFDSVFLERALLQQSRNEPIVNSLTPTVGAKTPAITTGISGYTFGLHPSSQTPVAVQPLVGGQPTSAQPIILKPGQIYRPHGKPHMKNGNFSALRWGIPFGWLGGGLATLYIFPSADADVAWPGNKEVIFHRQRAQILSCAGAPAAAPSNWPTIFPWLAAARGAAPIDQAGASIISLEPTRTLMSLRLGTLAAPAEMRVQIQGSDDFDLNASFATDPAAFRFVPYTWGTYVPCAGVSYPVVEAPTEWTRLGCNNDDSANGFVLTTVAGTPIENAFVDIVRYGRL